MQYVDTVVKRPIPLGSAMAIALFALVAGAAIALSALGLQPTHSLTQGPAMEPIAAAVEQVDHNRSEEGITGSRSVGAERIAHNRSEEGLADQ